MEDRFKCRVFGTAAISRKPKTEMLYITGFRINLDESITTYTQEQNTMLKTKTFKKYKIMHCTGLKDKNGKLIYEGDIVVIPNQYPYFDYPEGVDKDLNDTGGQIVGEAIPNYRGVVEWIYSQWQVIQHCVNPNRIGINNGMNDALNDVGFDESENSHWEIIGNIHETPELLEGKEC